MQLLTCYDDRPDPVTPLMAGAVILTLGAWFATTATATALEVVATPRLSVARAVKL